MKNALPLIRPAALLAAAMVASMVTIFFVTGVGQDGLQFVQPPADYLQKLLANPGALRAAVGFDNFFIVLYELVFLATAMVMFDRGARRSLVLLSAILLGLLGILDWLENFHFLVMLANAEQGVGPTATEVSLQVWESLLKFHLGSFGIVLLSFVLPQNTGPEKALVFLSRYVQVAIGILIYVTPRAVAVPLVFARFTYFLAAFLLVAWIFSPPRNAAG